MSDDYLWDGSGEPDPEVQRLEQLLSTLRSQRPAPDLPGDPTHIDLKALRASQETGFALEPGRVRRSWPLLAAAAIVLTIGVSWFVMRQSPFLWKSRVGWQVVRLAGKPLVGGSFIAGTGSLAVGEWIETDSQSRAQLDVGLIGRVEIEPNTRLRLEKAALTEHRLYMQRGKMHAKIKALPRLFFVNTPAVEAIDLGCEYTLEVDDTGASLLRVSSGWVMFKVGARESIVPKGAACFTPPGSSPGTPYYEDVSRAFKNAIDGLDFGKGDAAALDVILREARKKDSMTLWHLLHKLNGDARAAVYGRLASLIEPPSGVTREGILQLDNGMLARWHDKIDLVSFLSK